ncbi:galactose-1-phosphate uridylyltransferase [bacterium]|nr:galactose-1-phosphate uridylyltransferase [bacterium]
MSELRHDPVQKRWVIIAAERAKRPKEFAHEETVKPTSPIACPFCPGNEDRTPPEIYAVREEGSKPNSPGWKLRVIPNKFPVLKVEGELNRRGLGIYDIIDGIGAHEVIIETPDHNAHIGDMPLEDVFNIVKAYRERISDLHKDQRLRYVLIFKNYGAVAGASLGHPHSQLIATPITPRTVAAELDSAKEHYLQKERCLFCDIINQEMALEERIVFVKERFVAFCPFASRFPFEICLLPRYHHHDFSLTSDEDLWAFADALKDILGRLKRVLNNPPYNFMLHTAPNTVYRPGRPFYWETLPYDWHWHLEIIPRLTKIAGFEWGSGFYINPVPPESAAEALRNSE